MYEVSYCLLLLCKQVNLLTPRAFLPKVSFLDILEIFSLGMGQISSNLLKKAFATWQRAFLSTSVRFYDIFARACAEIKMLRQENDLRLH